MRPILLFSFLLLISLIVVAGLTIYTSPVNEKNELVWAYFGPFLVSLFVGATSLSSILFIFGHRLYERIIQKKHYQDQINHLKRYWKASIRRGILVGIWVTTMATFRASQIDNELNIALATSIVVLTEILLWRYYTR
jgi:hypothetical protein